MLNYDFTPEMNGAEFQRLAHSIDNAEQELLTTALKFIEVQYLSDRYSDDAHWMDDQDLIREKLALTAKSLVDLLNKLPKEDQPIGWNRNDRS